MSSTNCAAAERLVRALMLEGYVLYPYRRTSLKNMQRFAFGTLHAPRQDAGLSSLSVELLVHAPSADAPRLRVGARFLQYVPDAQLGAAQEPWLQALERSCDVPALTLSARATENGPCTTDFGFGDLGARVRVCCVELEAQLFRVRIDLENTSEAVADDMLPAALRALGAAHVIVQVERGRFVSQLEPPEAFAAHAARNAQRGCFPVLIGDARDDVMLASPIILYDRPAIAEQSAGDFYDATEIDEMLTLRVLTLTEREQAEARATDPRSREVIDRTLAQGEAAMLALHGARRPPLAEGARARARFAPGDSVRIQPKRGGDVMDLALAGERATIASIEEDFEGRIHYAVTVDADPGADLGVIGMPGHRFFFAAEELERVS